MDRASLLAATFALVVLLAASPAVGSLRKALVEQDSLPTPPVDSKSKPSANGTAAGSPEPPASSDASAASNSSSTPPPVTKKNNSSLSPTPPSTLPSDPPPQRRHSSPPQKPSSEESPPEKPRTARTPPSGGIANPSPNGTRSEAPAGGGKQIGREKGANYDCAGVRHRRCPGDVIICVRHPEDDTKEPFILVQNKGSANVTVSSSLSVDSAPVKIGKNSSEKIKLRSGTVPTSITLNVGGKSCSLSLSSAGNVDKFFQQLPAYATPESGAYAALFIAIVAGGSWACCKCQKRSRRVESGITYQQLEMGVQESTSVVDVNGDGWEQEWDNGWEDEDEETGSRTKNTQQEGRVSANSTPIAPSRSPARDEWEDWDD